MRVDMVQHPSITLDLANTGGIEVAELNQLRELSRRGIAATLYVARMLGEHDRVRAIRDFGWQHRYLQCLYYVNARLQGGTSDVLHGHYTPMLALLYPRRAIVHFHGMAVFALPLYRRAQCRARYHQAHYVFCAEWVMREFAAKYPDMPADHLHTVYYGTDHVTRTPRVPAAGHGPARLVFYGGWIEDKGIFELLEAIRILEDKRTDFEVHFGGSAFSHYRRDDSPQIDAKVRALADSLKTVKLIGQIDQADLTDLLATMDVGVFPSVYEEPFGLVATEMMAAGLPVVAFDVGGPRESIVHGETGFLVENRNVQALAQALETLIDNEQLRLQMGEQARRRVEQHFTWERHVDQLLVIYEQIIKRNRDGRR